MKYLKKILIFYKSRPWISLITLLAFAAVVLQLVSSTLPTIEQPLIEGDIVIGETEIEEVISQLGKPIVDAEYFGHSALFYTNDENIGGVKYFFHADGRLKLIEKGLPTLEEDTETLSSFQSRFNLGDPDVIRPVSPADFFQLHVFLPEGVGIVVHEESKIIFSYWFFEPNLSVDTFLIEFDEFFIPETPIGH